MKKELVITTIDGDKIMLQQEASGRAAKYFMHEGVKFLIKDPILLAAIESEDVIDASLSTAWVENSKAEGDTGDTYTGPGFTRGVVDNYSTYDKKFKRMQKVSDFKKKVKALDVELPDLSVKVG